MLPIVRGRMFLFVCGCGHSGTTVLASRLGNHSRALLIGRETNVFNPLYNPANGAFATRSILCEWDYFAEAAGKDFVVEKTPKHIHSLRRIWRVAPNAKIIIMKRNPLDNIASLYSRFGNFEASVQRWIVDNREVVKFKTDSRVRIVSYEALTEDPQSQLEQLLSFIGLPPAPEIMNPSSTSYDLVPQEGNMAIRAAQVRAPIRPNTGAWKSILTTDQVKEVLRRTRNIAEQLDYIQQGL